MSKTKKELLSGIYYTSIAKYIGIIISLIVSGILARLIEPKEFGIVAIATVIISFFSIFSDLGIAPAIIQNKELTNKDLSHIFSFTVWLGATISILFFLSSWPISWFYKSSKLLIICQILSINLFFAAANIVPNALLFKNKEFKFIAYRSLIIQTIGGGIASIAALMGIGLYALIINPIFSSILLFIISYRKKPQKFSLIGDIESIKKIFNYSVYLFMFTLQNITHIISPVMHPIFSDFQNDLKKLSTSYEKIIHLLAFIGFPLSVLLWFNAHEIILIVFGEQWIPSVSIFQTLSLSVGIQIILSTSGSIFQAANDTKSLFICGVFSTVLNVSGIIIGIFIFDSLEIIAWCIFLTFSINFILCYIMMYKITFKQKMQSFWSQLTSPLLLSFILIICISPAYFLLDTLSIFFSLMIKVLTFAIIYILYIQISGEYDIINLIKSKIKR